MCLVGRKTLLNLSIYDYRVVRIEQFTARVIGRTSYRLMPEAAINYRMAQNKQTHGYSFKFVIQQRLK